MANSKGIEVALYLTAYDKASRVINSFCRAGEAKLGSFSKKTGEIGDAAFKSGKEFGLMGLAIAGPLVYATKKAIDFEDKMADVAKVMNVAVGSSEFNRFGEDAKKLAVFLGESAENAAGLMASLAQGGVAKNDIKEVSKIAGQMGVAFGMSADMAGEKFIKMQNALGTSIKQTSQVADSINFLADSTAAAADQIVTYMASGGSSVASTMRVSGQASAAFGSALISIGKSGEESATIMEKFQKGIMETPGLMKLFKEEGEGVNGMLAVLEKGSQMTGEKQFKYFSQFGQYGTSIAQMAQNFEFTAKTVKSVANATQYANSVQKEFNNRAQTTKFKLDAAKAAFNNAAIGAGNAFLPVLTKLITQLTPLINNLTKWIQKNPQLTATIVKIVAGLAAMMFLTSGVSYAFGGAMKSVSLFTDGLKFLFNIQGNVSNGIFAMRYGFLVLSETVMTKLVPAFKNGFTMVSTAVGRSTAFLMDNPIILIITAIALAAFLVFKYWDQIKQFFISAWAKVKEIFWGVVDWVKEWGILFIGPVGFIIKYWDKIVAFFKGLGKTLYEAGKNIISSIFKGIMSFIHKPVDAIKGMVQKIRNLLPFSPAKEGALRDIHRIRLVETITESIKPRPLINAMRATTAAAMVAANAGLAVPGSANLQQNIINKRSGGATIVLHYSPNVTIQGGAGGAETKDNFMKMLNAHKAELMKLLAEEIRKQDRLKHN